MIALPMISSFFMGLRSAIIYDHLDSWLEFSLWYNVPFLAVMIVFLVVSIKSLSNSRKVAKSYSDVIEPQNTEIRSLLFCPNCGKKRTVIEKFCRTCGEEFK